MIARTSFRRALLSTAAAIYVTLGGQAFAAEPITLTIESAEASTTPSGEPTLNITLDAKGARKLADITVESVGKQLVVYIDGEVAFEPTIREPILGGQMMLQVPSGAERLAEDLESGQSVMAIQLRE